MTPNTVAWIEAFIVVLGAREVADPLKSASVDERLGDWTRLLTTAVVESCARVGWVAAAKGHRLDLLPKMGQEYLGLDVTAFCPPKMDLPSSESPDDQAPVLRWPMPAAVFELENSRDDDRVAYSLWKLACVRAGLRVLFAYRPDWESGRALVQDLAQAVVVPMSVADRSALGGETLILLGSRGEGGTFPHGFFKLWRLDSSTSTFRKVT